MLGHLDTDGEVESPAEIDRLGQVVRVKALLRNLKPVAGHPVTIDADDVLDAAAPEGSQPGAGAAAEVDHGMRLHQVHHQWNDGFNRAPRRTAEEFPLI